MDEDVGAKAPVTRLRRRLSVEAEDVKSPSTPSTPTKKRGRLATKPQLELIDENATEAVPKKAISKSIAKDLESEEKAVTPSRRSARIRSNTSLVAETTQSLDSPRAKRAARRTSQAGSDNESLATPGRQTRRTRKESTSSLDKQEGTIAVTQSAPKVEVIAEETATVPKNSTPQQTLPIRRSPRFKDKDKNDSQDSFKDMQENVTVSKKIETSNVDEVDHDATINKVASNNNSGNLSVSSSNLIKEMNLEPKTSESKLNNTLSVIETPKPHRHRTKSWTTITTPAGNDSNFLSDNEASKKRKSKGKSNASFEMGSGDGLINVIAEEKKETQKHDHGKIPESIDITNNNDLRNETIKLLEKTPTTEMQSLVYFEDSDSNAGSTGNNGEGKQLNCGDQCVPVVEQLQNQELNATCEPMDIDETIPENISITDYSNSSATVKDNTNNSKRKSSVSQQDQGSVLNCSLNKSKRKSSISNFDLITEQDNLKLNRFKKHSLSENSDKQSEILIQELDHLVTKNESTNKSRRKSSISQALESNTPVTNKFTLQENTTGDYAFNNICNQSKRKSIPENIETSITEKNYKSLRKSSLEASSYENDADLNTLEKKTSAFQVELGLEKTSNENKSTLILSELKDVTENDVNNTSKSSIDADLLSKSVDESNVTKNKKDKKKSVDYSTSTPLQQKPFKKHGMQINTSVINGSAKSEKNVNKSKENSKNMSKIASLNESSSSDESESELIKSKIIDDEAEEASDNYESGDSRNDDERQYEEENEIIEKGETLDSEDEDFSDDPGYENDSFVVSSDEADNELLNGSGDDLSLSDNELSMSKKSKQKFNERKRKEQKKASKEMYDSRHRSDDSKTSSKIKMSNRRRLDSTLLKSEDEIKEPKKSNRLRLDSSRDEITAETNAVESISKNKKISTVLSESVCNESTTNEKEITMPNESFKKQNDPLSMSIKPEPRTPQKDLNMSTILIKEGNKMEEVHVDENVTMIASNETSDPLHETMADDDSSSSSDNMEIIQNYDSILNQLNDKAPVKRIKQTDISLNLDKKSKKQKSNTSIVDNLNLTVTKESKPYKNKTSAKIQDNLMKETIGAPSREFSDEDGFSDSIDMRLLFPEDSNDSDNLKNNEADNNDALENFIPLKRTEAKTNLRKDLDEIDSNESVLNKSTKNNKKQQSSQSVGEQNKKELDENEADESNLNISKSKKKNKKRLSAQVQQDEEQKPDQCEEPALNTSKSKKYKKRQSSHSEDKETGIEEEIKEVSFFIDTQGEKANKSLNTTTQGSAKKKNRSNVSFNIENDAPTEVFTEKKKKKDKHDSSNIESDEGKVACFDQEGESALNMSKSKKSKKRQSSHREEKETDVEEQAKEVGLIDTTGENGNNSLNMTAQGSAKKKNKSKLSFNIGTDTVSEVLGDKKKKKDKQDSNLDLNSETQNKENGDFDTSTSSLSKKKKNKRTNQSMENSRVEMIEADNEEPTEIIINTSAKKQILKLEISKEDISRNIDEEPNKEASKESISKKRKRKMSAIQTDSQDKDSSLNEANLSEPLTNSKKKKQKINTDKEEMIPSEDKGDATNNLQKVKAKKSKKGKHPSEDAASELTVQDVKTNKKRKQRDDDESSNKSKIFKEHSFDKVHVSRLPESVLHQLEENPKRLTTTSKVISTSNFIVKEAQKRKNKPSNYLEDSIYLNDDSLKVKKRKNIVIKPKVLPFLPSATTSNSGYTSNFKINMITSQETQFVAQSSDVTNFKNNYLDNKKIKRLGTFENYKKQRNVKLSKYW